MNIPNHLMRYFGIINKEIYFDPLGRKTTVFLDGENDPLVRLSNRTMTLNNPLDIGTFYHLNLLQSLGFTQEEPYNTLKKLAKLPQRTYPDLVAGERIVMKGLVIKDLSICLTDIWYVPNQMELFVYRPLQRTLQQAAIDNKDLWMFLEKGDPKSTAEYLMLVSNIARARFFYGSSGYFELLIEIGRLLEKLETIYGYKRIRTLDISGINNILRFDPEKYSVMVVAKIRK